MRFEILVTKRIVCNFLSEVIFILLPICAILGIKLHGPYHLGTILSEKELSIASILLCGSAIRRRYLINYKRIGQRQTEDLFIIDILIAFLTASSLLFSFVVIGSNGWLYIGQDQIVMLIIALTSLYIVCQLEANSSQYLRTGPLKDELSIFFHVFRSELVHIESEINDCTNAALRITPDIICENEHGYNNKNLKNLELNICCDNIENIKSRFEIIQRRATKASEHMSSVKTVLQQKEGYKCKDEHKNDSIMR